MYNYTLSVISAPYTGGLSTPRPNYLPGENRRSTQFTGGWVDPTAGLGGCGKSRPRRD